MGADKLRFGLQSLRTLSLLALDAGCFGYVFGIDSLHVVHIPDIGGRLRVDSRSLLHGCDIAQFEIAGRLLVDFNARDVETR